MKLFQFILLFFIIAYSSAQTIDQTSKSKQERSITYKGIVLDEDNQPIPFVNVFMAKGKYGTTTDFNGEFTLKTRRKRGRMTFSATGYETLIIRVNPQKTYYKVILKEEKNVLDEVVIVQRPKKRLKRKRKKIRPIPS